jgi:methionine-rich copper-binding protein CopC
VGGRLEQADAAPDDGMGKDYNAIPCAGPATGSTPPLAVTLTTKSASRKKAKKSVALKLTASEPVTGLAATLVKGTKTYAKGKLAQLEGAGTLKLKIKRKLAKGAYTLDLEGTDAAGQLRRATFRFKVKK